MVKSVNAEEFKSSLGKFPTGVTIISTIKGGELFGFTANSFTSVSLEPPLVSFCLNKNAGSTPAFTQSSHFSISILAENQTNISRHFSTGQPNKFLSIDYQICPISSCPVIKGAVCWIECKKVQEYAGGDHIIFIGEVIATQINNNLNPLIYFAKSYHELK